MTASRTSGSPVPLASKPLNVLGYCRVSLLKQEDGFSLEHQEQRIRQECDRRDWTALEIVRESGSGKDLHRPGLQQALARIAKRQADGLVVAKYDRLSRSVLDFSQLLDWFQRADRALVVLDPQIDTSTPMGRAMAHMLMTFAQFEREMIGQRTSEGLAEKRRQGIVFGPPCVPPETVEFVREIRDRGASYRGVAEVLNDRGVPTARGGRWRASTVFGILSESKRRPSRRRAAVLPEVKR